VWAGVTLPVGGHEGNGVVDSGGVTPGCHLAPKNTHETKIFVAFSVFLRSARQDSQRAVADIRQDIVMSFIDMNEKYSKPSYRWKTHFRAASVRFFPFLRVRAQFFFL
jgi:hypothetical protein